MPKSYLLWLKWIPLTVAFMSGVFSLYRELYGLYVGVIPPKSLFWECIWTSFIVSAAVAWIQEHRKYLAEAEKTLPRVCLRIHSISYAQFRPDMPDTFLILFTVSVRNTGAPSVVDGWRLEIEDASGLTVERVMIPKTLSWQYPNTTFDYSSDDAIYNKVGDVPLPPGGKKVGLSLWKVCGPLMVEAARNQNKLKFKLTARDVNGGELIAEDRADDQEYVGRYYPGIQTPA